ncbi:polymer-forming cytoskeletal protein [Muriicola sp. E247]|uniref:bactofilin family protein n=1 Tax=Muriicola sp. E247 TaxID=3242730 RepID=UPI0035244E9F
MFSDNKKPKAMTELGGQPNRIEKHTKIKGDIVSEADFRIDGKLNGNLKTSGKVVIGKDGYIHGKVECLNADIEGNFNGELLVSELLTLKSSAFIEGTVAVAKLAVEPGATFNASCNMKGKGASNTTTPSQPAGATSSTSSAYKSSAAQSKNEPAKAS